MSFVALNSDDSFSKIFGFIRETISNEFREFRIEIGIFPIIIR